MIEGGSLTLVGPMPPPLTGQAVATKTLLDLLDAAGSQVNPVDIGQPETREVIPSVWSSLATAIRGARQLRHVNWGDQVVWTSVSPSILGRLRDATTVLRYFPENRPLSAVVHWGDFSRLRDSRLARRLTDRVDRFVFLSSDLSSESDWIPDQKKCVIPNTLSSRVEEALLGIQREPRAGQPRHLFVGHIGEEKGAFAILDTLSRMPTDGRPFVRFVGRFPDRRSEEAFSSLVRRHQLHDCVDQTTVNHEPRELAQMYEWGDALLLPTQYRHEAQPLVVLEAMASGLPVIATRWRGIPDMLGRAGTLLDPTNPHALHVAMEEAVTERESFNDLAHKARQRYLGHFSNRAITSIWSDHFASLSS